MFPLQRALFSLIALVVLFVTASVARADTVNVAGVDSGGFSTAVVQCSFNAQTNTFTFTITNTSAITQPGSTSAITAIGFDLGARGNASSSGLNGFTGSQVPSATSSFTFTDGALGTVSHGFGSPPAVVLDFAFITGNNFSGGQVNLGLLPGESASFTVSGAAFAGMTEAEICNAIYVRFQNVPEAGGSGGSDVGVPTDTPEVPEPATLFLFGSGVAGVAAAMRRRLSKGN